jgi:NAD(P)-dependent dehydrogenase (short-subunit alcohol dehydrogenase family)
MAEALLSAHPDSFSLAGKVALVTGGTRGIGRAIAHELSTHGALVAVCGRDLAQAVEVAASLPGESIGVAVDLTDAAGPREVVGMVTDGLGSIDLLVNNAGTHMIKPSLEVEHAEWQAVLDLNLTSLFFLSTAAAAAMEPAGGAIVSLSSIAGLTGLPQRAAYSASKAAVVALTRVLAVEWAPRVRVNAIAPGYVRTDLVAGLIDEGGIDPGGIEQRTPIGRLAEPAEIARAVAFLLSDAAGYITGQTIAVDGGWLANGAA